MASGDTLLVFRPQDNEPPSTAFAQLDTRNEHPVLDFQQDTTNEQAVFSGVMPQHYAGTTGVTVHLHYAMSSATSGTCEWDVEFERIGDQGQNLDSDGFAAANSASETVPGTAGLVSEITIAFTDGADMDSVVAGDSFRIRVTRDGITDTATGDAELRFIELRET